MVSAIKIIARAKLAFMKDRSGATAIEYGLIAAGIAVVIVGVVFSIGGELQGTFQEIVDCLKTPATCGTTP